MKHRYRTFSDEELPVGLNEGKALGKNVGRNVGNSVGILEGRYVGCSVGMDDASIENQLKIVTDIHEIK